VKRQAVIPLLVILLLSAACGKKTQISQPRPGGKSASSRQGLASFYGYKDGYEGKTTANGEKMRRDKLTAAHYDLPFGTRVRVQNLKNGKKVVVRINDRLPLVTLRRGRIIDLSYKAAQTLGMVRAGVVPVLLEILSR
jgi:rare lipoprotein A